MQKLKYYVVWRGRQTGIFDSWEICKSQVHQFPKAAFKGFRNRTMAEIAWKRGEDFAFGNSNKSFIHTELFPAAIISPSICVDAACNSFTGEMEFRGVLSPEMREIFSYGPFEKASINLGEFLAIVTALQYCHDRSVSLPIYSDSQIALGWVRKKLINTGVNRVVDNEPVFALIDYAVNWLRRVNYPNQLLKWDTEKWDENPADYGRK